MCEITVCPSRPLLSRGTGHPKGGNALEHIVSVSGGGNLSSGSLFVYSFNFNYIFNNTVFMVLYYIFGALLLRLQKSFE